MKEVKKEKAAKLPSSTEIMPLKDHHIVHNEHNIKIVKGEKCRVPDMFLQNLKTEKVIKKG